MRRYRQDVIGVMKGYLLNRDGQHMISRDGEDQKKVYVPVIVDGHPDLPYSIYIGRHVAILTGTCPVTYSDVGIPMEAEEAN